MTRSFFALASPALVASLVLASTSGCARLADEAAPGSPIPEATPPRQQQAVGPGALPSWFQFLPRGQAQQWVYKGLAQEIRLHGWTLFAALNQPVAYPSFNYVAPVWQTWPTTSQLFPYAGGTLCPDGTPLPPGPVGRPITVADAAVGLNARNLANAETLEGLGDDADQINLPGPAYLVPPDVLKRYPQCVIEVEVDGERTYQLIDGTRFQSNGDSMLANVVYDPVAADRVRQWASASFLDSKLPSLGAPPVALEMPENSVVLKPMQWPVKGGQGNYTALPVWAAEVTPAQMWFRRGQYAGFEIRSTDPNSPLWANAVAVTAGVGAGPQAVTFPAKGYVTFNGTGLSNTYPWPQAVSVEDFYHREYTSGDLLVLESADPCDRALLDASAFWTYGRRFEPGDYLVTVAMHIMTKEQPDWTFQSVWWSPQATSPPNRFAKFRPTRIPAEGPAAVGPWNHYVMESTWGMKQSGGPSGYGYPPNAGTGLWPVAMNPYIELAAHHPIATNCMNCHHRAAWPNARVRKNPQHPHDRQASYLASARPGPIEPYPLNDPALFAGLVTVDSMWAVSDRACYTRTGDDDAEGDPMR